MAPPQAIPTLCQMEYTSVQVSYLWFPGRCHTCPRAFNNGLGGDSNSDPVLAPWRLFRSDSNNGPSLGHANLVSDELYICSGLLFMMSWWLPYLAKGLEPDFNNGPRNQLNGSRSLDPRRLFETDLNNGPSQAIPNPVSDEVDIFSGLLLMVFWWVSYLSKGRRPDFNNGLGGDSKSGPV